MKSYVKDDCWVKKCHMFLLVIMMSRKSFGECYDILQLLRYILYICVVVNLCFILTVSTLVREAVDRFESSL